MKFRKKHRRSSDLAELELVHLVYPFAMSQGAFNEFRRGYKDSVEKFDARRPIDFLALIGMIDDAPKVFVAKKPYVYRPTDEADARETRPLGDAQVQFTIVAPGRPYEYTDEDGSQALMRMDRVLDAFEEGAFLPGHAVQLPQAMLRIDPLMSPGVWV